jgi:hypothetical protein
MDALDKQPRPALPEVAAGPVKSRQPLPPRPGAPVGNGSGAR